ncbi:MAG: hypothetical protein H7Z12_09505 [Rhodospirillaceae bacterium]|nr:hypothetical protein [Rhodospirillales bacterium]
MNFPRFTFMVSPIVLAAALSACAQFDMPKWPGNEGTANAAPRSTTADAPAKAAPVARPAKSLPELKALRPAARPAVDKDIAFLPTVPPKLVGLSEDETADLLGRPVEETTEPPGKVWVYKASGCQLSVHLFPDMERGGFYALDYTADSARESCLGKVAGEARKKGGAAAEESAKPS